MFAICIESSHQRGMGHFFRMLNLARHFKQERLLFVINDDMQAKKILKEKGYDYVVANLDDLNSNWESGLISKYAITHWINDRLNTSFQHAQNVRKSGCKIVTFDDYGSGAQFSDLNILALCFADKKIQGKKVLKGPDYLILNPEIKKYRRKRVAINSILVTLGGSDTYGVTIKILLILKKFSIPATIHIGPSFKHRDALDREIDGKYKTIENVPSLIEMFSHYDLAITGGGITPFEANASGLPALIVANETFEIENGLYLASVGSSIFLGHHESIKEELIQNFFQINIEKLSMMGMEHISTSGLNTVMNEIEHL